MLTVYHVNLPKNHALSFNRSDSIFVTPFDFIHSNIWGLSPNATVARYLNIMLFL